jgi:predicted nucleic acid-binding protein
VKGYLLDTNILSELRKRERTALPVKQWFAAVADESLYLSVLVLGEIRRGIELRRRKDLAAAQSLEKWLMGLELGYAERILPVTSEVGDRWGRLSAQSACPPIDGLLAATALEYDLTLVTRNVADIIRTGVNYLNPF